MRINIIRKDGPGVGGSSFTGGTLTSPLILAGDPTQPLEAATKRYVDNGLAALNANNLTSGTIPVARLPAFTGDVSSSAGTNTFTLSNTGVTAGTYAKVTVDAKGRVTAGTTLAASDIPNLDWSKITTGKPTTLSGYGITDGVSKSGGTLTGPLVLAANPTQPLEAATKQYVDNSLAASSNDGVEFIASGNIPNAGLTVGLNANGTVSVITGNEQSQSQGNATIIYTGHSHIKQVIHDPANNKIIIMYTPVDHNEIAYAHIIVGTISENTILFGQPVFIANVNIYQSIRMLYEPKNQKVVIAYFAGGQLRVRLSTVSGNSISLGSENVADNIQNLNAITMVYDHIKQKVIICYSNTSWYGGAGFAKIIVSTVSGNSISFGTPINLNTFNTDHALLEYDFANNKVVMVYHRPDHNALYAVVGNISGNSILFGSPTLIHAGRSYQPRTMYDSVNQKIVIIYFYNTQNNGSLFSNPGHAFSFDRVAAVVGTVFGNSISFGQPVIIDPVTNDNYASLATSVDYVSFINKVAVVYTGRDSNYHGVVRLGTVIGNSISFDSPVVFHSAHTHRTGVVSDPINKKIVIAYANSGNHVAALVYTPSGVITNKNTFIGISQNSATNGSTVRVKIKGQVDSNQSGLTPGQIYYVSDNGALTTVVGDNVLAGKAISPTKLLITN